MGAGSASTREKMFKAALELIADKGVSATTVDEIVERAGVAKGTVYYHFSGGKTELIEALIASELTPLAERLRQIAAEEASPAKRIAELVRAELAWIRDNRDFAKMLVTELWREERAWRDSLVLLRKSILGYFRDAIAEGVAAGAFRADLDPDFAASALFGMTVTVALDWLVFYPERPLEFVAGQIDSLASAAVRTGEPTAGD
ncbi:MAG: TetR/AcrR family transcriptional regulator [Coriobacteriia bacterium]|nr:TetR/AcrR family transcriptional regulator [Coriobacteriia bacterium]